MSASLVETCRHEARHVVSCWFLGGRRVDFVRVGNANARAEAEGIFRSTLIGRGFGIEDVIIALSGWLGDEDLPEGAVWPEPSSPWPMRLNAPEGLGRLTRDLGLSQAQYEAACRVAQGLVEEPTFQEAVELVAKGLMAAPSIDREGLEILREAAGLAEPEGALCNT